MLKVDPAHSTRLGRAAWSALALICLTQALSMVDRQILAILLPRIKADLQVGDAEMGLLYGTVFALFYAVFSLPLGRLADGWVRTRLLALSIAGWSLFTGLAGFASSFGLLALSRLGVGIGEASTQPAGMSLISDHFPRARRGTATAAMAAAIALGLGGALWIGGAVADRWDAAWPLAPAAPLGLKGWQAAFIVAALPGLLLALVLWRMPEPRRGAMDGIAPPLDPHPGRAALETLASVLPGFNWLGFARLRAGLGIWIANLAGLVLIAAAMWALAGWTEGLRHNPPPPLRLAGQIVSGNTLQWAVTGFGLYAVLNWLQSLKLRDAPSFAVITAPTLLALFAIAALQSVINYGLMGWTPAFIMKSFGRSPAETGLEFGALSAGLGIAGPLIAGPLSDRIAARVAGGRLWVTLGSMLLAPGLAWWTYRSGTVADFYLRFALFSIVLTMWLAPIYASFMDLALPRMRGSVMSFYIITMTITGLGIGPYSVGLLSDINGGRIGDAILSLYVLAPFLILLSVIALRRLPRDEALVVERARAAGEPV